MRKEPQMLDELLMSLVEWERRLVARQQQLTLFRAFIMPADRQCKMQLSSRCQTQIPGTPVSQHRRWCLTVGGCRKARGLTTP